MNKRFYKIATVLLGKENGVTKDIALLFFRLVIGVFMLTHGLQKLSNFEMLRMDFPDPIGIGATASLVLIILAEAGCSLLIISGAFTRLAVIPLMFGMIIATFVTHGADPFSTKELALFYLLMYGVLALLGPGKYSVDFLLRRWLQKYNH